MIKHLSIALLLAIVTAVAGSLTLPTSVKAENVALFSAIALVFSFVTYLLVSLCYEDKSSEGLALAFLPILIPVSIWLSLLTV